MPQLIESLENLLAEMQAIIDEEIRITLNEMRVSA